MSILLHDPQLGELELRKSPFVVVSFEIGARAQREAVRPRANASGGFDDTRFEGGRVATVTIRLDDQAQCGSGQSMQALHDRLAPYLKAWRRPTLSWTLPGAPSTDRRSMVVRGSGAALRISSPKHPTLVTQWTSEDGEIVSVGKDLPISITVDPSGDAESGRTYNRLGDRSYPASLAIGDRLVQVGGNDPANWTLRIFGECTNPFFLINGTRIEWTDLVIPAGGSITVNTKERSMFYQSDPTAPVYSKSNYTDWTWPQIMLDPARESTLVRFGAQTLGVGAKAILTWSPTWA